MITSIITITITIIEGVRVGGAPDAQAVPAARAAERDARVHVCRPCRQGATDGIGNPDPFPDI